MPILNYSKPQSFVQQYLQVLTDAVAASRNAFIYGPQYRLSRYTNEDEKEAKDDAFTADPGSAEDVKAPAAGNFVLTSADYIGADETFDSDFLKIFAEDVEVALGPVIGNGVDTGFYLDSLAEPHKIVYNTDITGTATPTALPTVEGRPIKVGDYVEIIDPVAGVVTRQVKDFEIDGAVASVIVLDGAATLRHITQNWATAEEEILKVQVVVKYSGEIKEKLGTYTNYTKVANGVNFPLLPRVPVPDADLEDYQIRSAAGRLYMHYRAMVQPGANEPIKRIESESDILANFGVIDPDNWLGWGLARALSGSAGKVIYGARIREDSVTGYNEVLKKAAQNVNLYAHCPLTYDITIQQSVANHVNEMSKWDIKRWRRAYVATDIRDAYSILDDQITYEATIDATSRVLTQTVGGADFVVEGVAPEDVVRIANNEISVVKTIADVGGALHDKFFTLGDGVGTTVGVLFNVDAGVTTPTGANRDVEVAISTGDDAVTIAAAIDAAFSGDTKLSVVASGNVVTFTDLATGARASAEDGDGGGLRETGFTVLTSQQGQDNIADGYTEYVIEKVLGPVTVLLKTGPLVSLQDEAFEIWSSNTGTKQAIYAANRSEQLGTRRVINVWCDSGTRLNSNQETEVVENIFLAAEIAGLRSVALPHQGLTRTQVTSISDAPLMYTKYTEADLNIAAAAGVFIITQDLEDGPVYIRHQLTTDTSKGSLYYEDSVGVNVDDISFNIVSIIDGYIGKYNATPDTVQQIQNKINELLHNKARADRTQFFIGPQLLDYDPTDLEVEIDPKLRDQVNVRAFLTVPLPLNRIIVELYAGVSFNN